jgi:hypothetical protein
MASGCPLARLDRSPIRLNIKDRVLAHTAMIVQAILSASASHQRKTAIVLEAS